MGSAPRYRQIHYSNGMRRSHLSLLTAIVSLMGAFAWLAFGNAFSGLLWVAISLGWLITGIIQLRKADAIEPSPASRLLRRFSRLILFWS
jgi:hypothetical protein